jgi:hypothetical protein
MTRIPAPPTLSSIVAALTLLAFPVVLTAETSKERFLQDAPGGWARLRDAEQNIAGTLHLELWAIKDGKATDWGGERYEEFKRRGDLITLVRRAVGHPATSVTGVTPRYSFSVDRTDDAAPFVLRQLTSGSPEDAVKELEPSLFFYEAIQAPRQLGEVLLEKLVADPAFRLKQVSECKDGGKAAVRVEFDFEPRRTDAVDWKDAWMVLCPSEDWALQRAGYHATNLHVRVSIVNTYRKNKGGRLALFDSHKTSTLDGSQKRPHEFPDDVHHRFTFDDLEDKTIPESSFSLSEFGLPEPRETSHTHYQSHLHLWFFGIAIVFIGTAVALRLVARRHRNMP